MIDRPRTLTVLTIMLVGLVYVAMFPEADDMKTNIKFGTWAGTFSFLLFAMLQFRDGPFIRPHPAIWRVVLGLGVLYQMFLVFLLFQNKRDARYIISCIDPSLGVPLPERSYAENCELTYDNVKNQLDIFVIYHIVGWYAKAVVLRDYWFCWILSIMFEVMEYSLQHQLNNFAECWWDHWILDVLICNWAGLYLGMKTCEYFEMKAYSWRGIKHINTLKGKVKRTVQQFTPHDWTKFEWGTTKSFKNYIAVIGLLFAFLQAELNSFYLKYLLWIPPDNPLNSYRATLLFMGSIPATREGYQYLTDKNCKRFGPQAWLTISTIMTETIICFKFGQGEFPNPVPIHVAIFWTILISLLIGYAIWQFGIPFLKERMEISIKEQNGTSTSPSTSGRLKDKDA
ncbi:phosphatidyl serine synthase-domain-containing protein [Gigaspora rosea]|uniref:Phosphatidyl serine synthase-domain-containing protein n=1 Tax=Gigaspora rosea TaxID=44941 RepID=A0A397UYH5_9GLOM|nr:phosphatidyl serine synthase-domain-containing protein [Gigaspora rosea]